MLLNRSRVLELMKEGKIVIDPFDEELLGEGSLDIRIGEKVKRLKKVNDSLALEEKGVEEILKEKFEDLDVRDGQILIEPYDVIVAETYEKIVLKRVIGWLVNRHRYASLGINVSGFIFPKDKAKPSKQWIVIHNVGGRKVKLKVGEAVCQLVFFQCEIKK